MPADFASDPDRDLLVDVVGCDPEAIEIPLQYFLDELLAFEASKEAVEHLDLVAVTPQHGGDVCQSEVLGAPGRRFGPVHRWVY
jgi:hypothetical protein